MRMLIIAILLFLPATAELNAEPPKSPAIEKALGLVDSNKPVRALKMLSEFRPSAADLSLYHYVYARAYALSGRDLDSLSHLRLAYIYSRDEDMKEHALIEMGERFFRLKYYPEAAMSFKQFLRDFPKSPRAKKARLELADSLYLQGRFSEALLNYELSSNSVRAVYGRANTYYALGRTKDAYTLYMSVLGKDRKAPDSSPGTVYRIAETFRLMGKLSDAKNYYDSIKDSFFKSKADIGLGLIALGEAQFESARGYFNSALQSPDRRVRSEALLHLAECYLKTGGQDGAKSSLAEIRTKYAYSKEYDQALLMLSGICDKEGRRDEALSYLKELASCSYLDEATADGLEKMLSDARNKDAGEFLQLWDMFGRFLLDPRRSKFLLDAAETLGPSGKPFLHLCSWLIRNGSSDVRPRCSLMLAGFYADMGNPDKASALIRGIKGNRDDVLRVKARIYKDKTKYQNAMAAIFSIREMKPADLLFLTGMLDQTKNITKAVRFCEKSLNAAGAPPKVYVKLADALYNIGRKRDALRFYKTIVSLSPGNEKGLTKDDIAWAHYMLLKLSGGDDPFVIPGPAVQGDTLFSRSEEASLKEAHILERIKEVL